MSETTDYSKLSEQELSAIAQKWFAKEGQPRACQEASAAFDELMRRRKAEPPLPCEEVEQRLLDALAKADGLEGDGHMIRFATRKASSGALDTETQQAVLALNAAFQAARTANHIAATDALAIIRSLKEDCLRFEADLSAYGEERESLQQEVARLTEDADKASTMADELYETLHRFKATATDLTERVDAYRYCHDKYGDGKIETGRAWDKMRQSREYLVTDIGKVERILAKLKEEPSAD